VSSTTAHLGLITWVESDPFKLADFVSNLSILDASPGMLIATSTTRPGMAGGPPAWGAAQNGRALFETDTQLRWIWNGTTFVRYHPRGLLAAPSTLTSTLAYSGTAYEQVLQNVVTVPSGGRSVMVITHIPTVLNTGGSNTPGGVTAVGLFRDSLTTGQLTSWTVQGDSLGTASDQPRQGSTVFVDTPTAGAHTYYLGFATISGFGGTSKIIADAAHPADLAVVEV